LSACITSARAHCQQTPYKANYFSELYDDSHDSVAEVVRHTVIRVVCITWLMTILDAAAMIEMSIVTERRTTDAGDGRYRLVSVSCTIDGFRCTADVL